MRPNATIKNVQRVFGGGDSTLGLIVIGDAIKSGEYGGEPENMIILILIIRKIHMIFQIIHHKRQRQLYPEL